MMKIIKKNQLTLLVLALMLVTAGYLNYNSNQNVTTGTEIASIGDATLVSSNVTENNNSIENNNALVENNTENSIVNQNESSSITTNSDVKDESEEYYSSARLERDKMYSQMLESYQKILDSNTTSNTQKEAAQKEITNINNTIIF